MYLTIALSCSHATSSHCLRRGPQQLCTCTHIHVAHSSSMACTTSSHSACLDRHQCLAPGVAVQTAGGFSLAAVTCPAAQHHRHQQLQKCQEAHYGPLLSQNFERHAISTDGSNKRIYYRNTFTEAWLRPGGRELANLRPNPATESDTQAPSITTAQHSTHGHCRANMEATTSEASRR